MVLYRIALIIHRPSSSDEFLVVRQPRPPMPPGDEYETYSDSDLFDLPSAPLHRRDSPSPSDLLIRCSDSSPKLDLHYFDIESAMEQALSQLGLGLSTTSEWELRGYEEEPEFGPGPPVQTVFVLGRLMSEEVKLQDMGRWLDVPNALKLMSGVNPCCDRVGPLVTIGLVSAPSASTSRKWNVPPNLRFQEYPLGVTIVPMHSRTEKPFWTTNLVVVSSNKDVDRGDYSTCFAYGDAILVDPGCSSKYHSQLAEVVLSLPSKLVVLVTHHHNDHTDGLSIVQKYRPDAILLAHENTMNRIGKDNWSIGYIPVSGGEKIQIGAQQLEVIFAPGHTDGHTALLHVCTNSLIVGDHCVGEGSAFLDVTAGGNMKDYFQTTYKFMELSPHVIIPMHGRVNIWPKRMLCGYLKHRRDRELSILKAIESGARTLFDIVSASYDNVDVKLWIHASSNVRIHVEHLAYQGKLPKDFMLDTFYGSFKAFFDKLDVAKTNI